MNERVINYLDMHGLLVEEQNGFRRNRSCVEHLYSLNSILNCKLKENKEVFGAFIDFEKAFDRINRNLLMLSLLEIEVGGKFVKAFQC